jgi:ubiquinol-cytochrome c reductase cytochrome b subunit
VFFVPTFGGLFLEAPNFEAANPLSTPDHIAPVWYFTPFFAILRAVPNPGMGALLMAASLAVFMFLPWLDRSPVKSLRYRPLRWRVALAVFVISFVALGYLGLKPADGIYVLLARIFTGLYFAFFVFMPFYTRGESTSRVPDRVTFHHD